MLARDREYYCLGLYMDHDQEQYRTCKKQAGHKGKCGPAEEIKRDRPVKKLRARR